MGFQMRPADHFQYFAAFTNKPMPANCRSIRIQGFRSRREL
jgi:hypothetical protein